MTLMPEMEEKKTTHGLGRTLSTYVVDEIQPPHIELQIRASEFRR
jgi:hypothetical protein